MIRIIIIAIICLHAVNANCQATYERVDYKTLDLKSERYCSTDSNVITTDSAWKDLLAHCGITTTIEIDFSKYVVLHKFSLGDKNAYFKHYVFFDHRKKRVTWIEYKYYGGSRAGGFFHFWIQVPKPPEGYGLKYTTIKIDHHKSNTAAEDTLNRNPERFLTE